MRRVELRAGEPAAPEVTFLHGFLGAPEQIERVASMLPREVAVSAVVVPGHGPAPAMTPASFAEVSRAISATFPPTRPRVLVGYSLGGRLALGAAVAAPLLWRAVVAIGAHAGVEDPTERAEKRSQDVARAELVVARGIERFVDAWEREGIFATQASLDAPTREAQRRMRLAHTPEGIAWSLLHLGSGAMPVLDVSKIRGRVILVAGERDPRFAEVARRLAPTHGWEAPRIVAGAGHNVVLEAPRETRDIIESALFGEGASLSEITRAEARAYEQLP